MRLSSMLMSATASASAAAQPPLSSPTLLPTTTTPAAVAAADPASASASAASAASHDDDDQPTALVPRAALELLKLKDQAMDSVLEGITIADARRPDMPLIYVRALFFSLPFFFFLSFVFLLLRSSSSSLFLADLFSNETIRFLGQPRLCPHHRLLGRRDPGQELPFLTRSRNRRRRARQTQSSRPSGPPLRRPAPQLPQARRPVHQLPVGDSDPRCLGEALALCGRAVRHH